MVLILSNKNDLPTQRVARHLEAAGEKILIITDEEPLCDLSITNDDIQFTLGDQRICFSEIKSYWYRRGNFLLPPFDSSGLNELQRKDFMIENSMVIDLLHNRLLGIPHLGCLYNADLNRAETLIRAKKAGLKIPPFGIFNSKADLCSFKNNHEKIIIKPLGNGLHYKENNKNIVTYTALFTEEDADELPEVFPPALFMKYIPKKYELRIFYLDGECYTLAIFSQTDSKTEIDYRKYNDINPNRNASYALPGNTRECIIRLMNLLRLQTGSIDMIVTKEDEFIFLEVNPVGQFLLIEELGNYDLTGKIADHLIKISAPHERA